MDGAASGIGNVKLHGNLVPFASGQSLLGSGHRIPLQDIIRFGGEPVSAKSVMP